MSSLLLIVVMEALNMMLLRTRELELFKSLKVGRDDHMDEVTNLFFADNTLIFYVRKESAMLNLITILLSFQAVQSVTTINLNLRW